MALDIKPRLEAEPAAWLQYYFPDLYDRPFAQSQLECLGYVKEIEADKYFQPIILCDPRGLGKSTVSEGAGVYLFALRRRNYWLITSETDQQALKHQDSVRKMLESPRLLADYPHLKAKVQSVRKALEAWSSEKLICDSGQQIEFTSLLGKMRGFKSSEGKRPDFWTPDDIDNPTESSAVTQKKREIMRKEFLPALAKDKNGELLGSVLWPQNLIHRNSVIKQVLDFTADMLNDRRFIGPNPLLENGYDAERVWRDGKPYWIITSGEPFDPSVSLKYCEQLLNQLGKSGFDQECQQLVDVVDPNNDFTGYDEIYHVATVSEVIEGFKRQGAQLGRNADGSLRIPDRWESGDGLDWGTTPAHPSAYTLFARPDKRYPFDDLHLGLIEQTLPEYPYDLQVTPEAVSPGRVAARITERRAKQHIERGQIKMSLMSHEASAALNAFLLDCPDETKVFFAKWKAQVGSGVPAIQNLLEVDKSRPHPFRVYPKGHEKAGQPVMGYTRFLLVVADGQGELYVDGAGVLRVTGATSKEGFARARFEIPLYSHRHTGQAKIDDDWVDAARGCLAQFSLRAGSLTASEQVDRAILAAHPEASAWTTAGLAQMDPVTRQRYEDAARETVDDIRRQIMKRRRPASYGSDLCDAGSAEDLI